MPWPSMAVNSNIWQILARVLSVEGCLMAILDVLCGADKC